MAFPVRTIAESLIADDQELRACELESMQLHTRGKNVRDCKQYGNRTCKDRACVVCAERTAQTNAAKVKQALRTRLRGNAQFVILALPSRGPFDLAPTLDQLQQGIRDWRRRAAVQKVVLGAVGQIEPKLANRLWSTHAHLLLHTSQPEPHFGNLGEAWELVTGGRGSLVLRPDLHARVSNIDRAAQYCTKRQDWCPDPGAIPLGAHQQLLKAIKGRRLFVCWGTGLPPKEPRCASV